MHKCYIFETKNELVNTIVTTFGTGVSYRTRLFFIEFCARMLEIASEREFMGAWCTALLKIHTDSVYCVKYKFVTSIVNTRSKLGPDVDSAPFVEACQTIAASSSEDVATLAREAADLIRSESYP